jgi:Tfp pilus assembly protein PilV
MNLNPRNPLRRAQQRGATMVSVMLLTVSLLTVSLLVVQSSTRELQQSSGLIARERALMSARAAIDLGVARYREAIANAGDTPTVMTPALAGYHGNNATCDTFDPDAPVDCIPMDVGGALPVTGQRNEFLTSNSDCAGRPCMRPGALSVLPDTQGGAVPWIRIPMADLVDGGDPEAMVTLWVRNNTADAIGAGGGASGSWVVDGDGRVVFTAMAQIRNTTVAIEQEVQVGGGLNTVTWQMESPDEGYGGGHNNDNSAVVVCRDQYLGAD